MNESSALLNQLRIDRTEPPPPQRRGRSWIIPAAIVLSGTAVATFAFTRESAVPVRAVAARAMPSSTEAAVASVLDASGYVVARRQATVSAKITDKVTQVLIEEGQHVQEGDVVARLDDTNVRAAFAEADARLAMSKASLAEVDVSLANAQRDYARKKDLFQQHFVSQADLDNSQTALDGLRAQQTTAQRNAEVSRRELEVSQRNLDDTIVRAPFTGLITVKAAQPGEIVSPISAGGGFTRTGIGTIVDMDSLEFQVDVNENFINRVTSGQAVTAKLNAYPDWNIPAHVIAVIPTADRSKGTVSVRIAIDQKDARILPEMGVRVSFMADAARSKEAQPSGVLIPADAVQPADKAVSDASVVWVIRDHHVERRAVRLGIRNGADQIVTAGLTAGESVAIGDFASLKDQTSIKLENQP